MEGKGATKNTPAGIEKTPWASFTLALDIDRGISSDPSVSLASGITDLGSTAVRLDDNG